ncbi:MAG: SMP-30/gluconolactonase/LRE family protein [Planctomycetales bacterium]|nr:SMP-30/gluconolactonase/LRE family protein [Planctomycetales bacterium]
MRHYCCIAMPVLLLYLAPLPLPAGAQDPVKPHIERLDPALDAVIDVAAPIEILADGREWSEGPVWLADQQAVIFSDIPNNAIMRWKEGEGLTEYLKPAGYTGEKKRGGESGSNGLALDQQGRLLLCQHGDRRVARMDAPLDKPAAKFVTLADRWDGKRFNSPNDLAVHPSGAIYFTDPPYGLEKQVDDPARELDFQGVYRLGSDGTLSLLYGKMTRPNGIGFSPDYKRCYVAQSDPDAPIWMAFDVAEDGSLKNGRVFFDATHLAKDRQGLPDGLKVDKRGNVFATGPGGVLILSPEGKHLGTVITGQATANCTFGGPQQDVLYMTADMFLMRVALKHPAK